MQATLIQITDPMRPRLGRRIATLRRRTRVATLLRRRGLVTSAGARRYRLAAPFIVVLNGEPLVQREWRRCVEDGDMLVIMPLVKGGGGSNPLQILAMIAVVIVSIYAPYAAGLTQTIATATGTITTVTAGGALLSAGVMIAGSMLVNAILPAARPDLGLGQQGSQPSPTYGINAQGNSARLLSAIPVLYGRHKVVPDFGSQPYTEYIGNEQYLYQLFVVTQGKCAIEQILIGESDISVFDEVQYEIIPPGGGVTLFPDNVETSTAVSGLELKGTNEAGADYVGPFVANASGTQLNYIGIDISLPNGLFYANNSGGMDARTVSFVAEAQWIRDDGSPFGNWWEMGSDTITMATNTPQVRSYRWSLGTGGRAQVRMRRTNEKDLDARTGNTLVWAGLRSYQPSRRIYGDVTMIATRIRATNNLNSQTARQLGVIATRILPVWNGGAWMDQPTRNPAWALADIFRNTGYGRGLPDVRLNLAGLLQLAGTWDARGDQFNGVFDSSVTVWDAATSVARAGRALPMYYAGVIDVIRDQPQTVRKAMFSPQNIKKGSWSAEYALHDFDSPDYVIVEYVDGTTWKPAEVDCALPGSAKRKAERVQLFGCTSRDQAWREGMYMAASHRDRRRFITFTTELDGHIPQYGDLVALTHDVPAWGYSGVVTAYNPSTGRLQLSEVVPFEGGSSYQIALRRRDGSVDGPHSVAPGDGEGVVMLQGLSQAQRSAIYVSDGAREEPTIYAFGPVDRLALDCLVTAVRPQSDLEVEVTCVNVADSVHTAEAGGDVPPPPSPSLLPGNNTASVIRSVQVRTVWSGTVSITAAVARNAIRYEFQISRDNGSSWVYLGDAAGPQLTVALAPGAALVRVRAIGAAAPGPWAVWTGTITEMNYVPGSPTLVLRTPFVGRVVQVDIEQQAYVAYHEIEVWTGGVKRRQFQVSGWSFDWSIEDATNANAVSPAIAFIARAVNSSNQASLDSSFPVTNPPPPEVGHVYSEVGWPPTPQLAITPATDTDLVRAELRIASTDGQVVWSGTAPATIALNWTQTYKLFQVDVWGNISPVSTINVPAQETGGS
ncbi:phage tail protein [Cupriavidus basilensis]|uniref:Phage tail protein n=1 Tax=Cupriavidus basilensis TaxID=68895 RepID=A0ABT6AXE6_9BURK|nr:phage tail protein [Cupriavidus basilensis]MDF3837159.1 phage tail protein [Cupriavidus basilensis]